MATLTDVREELAQISAESREAYFALARDMAAGRGPERSEVLRVLAASDKTLSDLDSDIRLLEMRAAGQELTRRAEALAAPIHALGEAYAQHVAEIEQLELSYLAQRQVLTAKIEAINRRAAQLRAQQQGLADESRRLTRESYGVPGPAGVYRG